MSNDEQSKPVQIREGYQPGKILKRAGFQPSDNESLKPSDLTPPKGDSAIQPAQNPADPPPAQSSDGASDK